LSHTESDAGDHFGDITGTIPEQGQPVFEPRLWRDKGWTAKVIKNDDDEGWAVAMFKDGEPEPALVGPWTMGRDKKILSRWMPMHLGHW
jgi:hypothetical protein